VAAVRTAVHTICGPPGVPVICTRMLLEKRTLYGMNPCRRIEHALHASACDHFRRRLTAAISDITNPTGNGSTNVKAMFTNGFE